MLQNIAHNIWHTQHNFAVNGLSVSSRMTVVRLQDGCLWLHSPVPITKELKAELMALGEVAYVVAPSKMHYLFAADCMAAFPQATLFGAPGLQTKRPNLKGMRELQALPEPSWQEDLEQLFFAGMPLVNETVWFHKPSRTLIVTDLLQYYQGDLSFGLKIYAKLTGTSKQLAVPKTVRWLVKDRIAALASAQKILNWPFERVVVAHNVILETDAYTTVEKAFESFK
jgi:Domain of unknown function (DUF4336)